MKKMLLASAVYVLHRMALNRRLLAQNKPAAVAPKETITHHFFVSGIGQSCRAAKKFVAAQKMLLKRNPANIRKWIARFLLWCYAPLEARVYCSQ